MDFTYFSHFQPWKLQAKACGWNCGKLKQQLEKARELYSQTVTIRLASHKSGKAQRTLIIEWLASGNVVMSKWPLRVALHIRMFSPKKTVIESASGALLSNANTTLAILTRSLDIIHTTGFSHLHQCVSSQRLKSTAIDFHVHVYVGSNKTQSGSSK